MRSTLPAATPPARAQDDEDRALAEGIEASLRRCVEILADTPRRLPELGTTRNDWPAHRPRRK